MINFPNDPTEGEKFSAAGKTWQWDGTVWNILPPDPDAWVRPAEWLPMPDVSPTEDKFAGLIAVFDHDGNYVELALKPAPEVEGSFEVDWGDGTVEEYAFDGGDLIVATHQYDFSNTNLTDTVSTLGYKQAMVVVTPIEGDWGYFSLQENAIPGTSPYQSPVNWLDIVFSGPSVTTLKLGLED